LIDSTLLTAFAMAVATPTDFDAWLQDGAHALFSPAAVFAARWRAECGDAPVPGRLGELYAATLRGVQAQPAELALETLDLAVRTWQAYRCAYPRDRPRTHHGPRLLDDLFGLGVSLTSIELDWGQII
jgi:hypothetical protein